MNEEITVRNAKLDDLDCIATLWREYMDFHKVRDPYFTMSSDGQKNFSEYIGKHILSNKASVLVAEFRDNVVAYSLAVIATNPPIFEEKHYGEFSDLAVSEPFRRQGIGELMVHKVHLWFKQKNIKRFEVNVALSNETSTAFWKKMGFTPYLETLMKEV